MGVPPSLCKAEVDEGAKVSVENYVNEPVTKKGRGKEENALHWRRYGNWPSDIARAFLHGRKGRKGTGPKHPVSPGRPTWVARMVLVFAWWLLLKKIWGSVGRGGGGTGGCNCCTLGFPGRTSLVGASTSCLARGGDNA